MPCTPRHQHYPCTAAPLSPPRPSLGTALPTPIVADLAAQGVQGPLRTLFVRHHPGAHDAHAGAYSQGVQHGPAATRGVRRGAAAQGRVRVRKTRRVASAPGRVTLVRAHNVSALNALGGAAIIERRARVYHHGILFLDSPTSCFFLSHTSTFWWSNCNPESQYPNTNGSGGGRW